MTYLLTHSLTEQEVKEVEAKLVQAKKALQKKEKAFQDFKASGGNVADLTRDVVNKLDDQINAGKSELKILSNTGARMESVLLSIEQGALGLLQRINPYLHLADVSGFESNTDEVDTISLTLNALSTAEQILAKMVEIVAGAGDLVATSPGKVPEDDEISVGSDKSMSTRGEAPAQHTNIRIKSKKTLRASDQINSDGAAVAASTIQATGLLDGGDTHTHGEDKIHSISTPKMVEDKDSDLPTRNIVKKNSLRTSQEFHRKEELEARRLRLANAMATRNASKQVDDDGIDHAARLKAQNAMAHRLCTIKAPPTLPEGSTLRDDTMTKTVAFLTKMPKLV
jgi:hypothetical protein